MAGRAEKQKTRNENSSVSFFRKRFLTPSEAAKNIQQRLEQSSGKSVVIDRSNELMGYATIRIASVDAPAHLFRYKPEFEPELPYLLAFQCGLALRTVEAKPGNRFDVSSTDALSIEPPQLVREHLRAHFPMLAIQSFPSSPRNLPMASVRRFVQFRCQFVSRRC